MKIKNKRGYVALLCCLFGAYLLSTQNIFFSHVALADSDNLFSQLKIFVNIEDTDQAVSTDRIHPSNSLEIRGFHFPRNQLLTLFISKNDISQGDFINSGVLHSVEIGTVSTGQGGTFSKELYLYPMFLSGTLTKSLESETFHIYAAVPDTGEVVSMVTFTIEDMLVLLYRFDDDMKVTLTEEAVIGDRIFARLYGFEQSRIFNVYLASGSRQGTQIDVDIYTYNKLGNITTDDGGTALLAFTVPGTLEDGVVKRSVTLGRSYIYFTRLPFGTVDGAAALTIINQQLKSSAKHGDIGTTLTVNGKNFGADEQIVVYFSSDYAEVNDLIDRRLKNYAIADVLVTDQQGAFISEFNIPDNLTDGNSGAAVKPGLYYFYAKSFFGRRILAQSSFIVVEPEVRIFPDRVVSSDEIIVVGSGFQENSDIEVMFDDLVIDIGNGDKKSDSSGTFTSFIEVPESETGHHLLSFTDVRGNTDEVDIFITPDLAIRPERSVVGSRIYITGSNFDNGERISILYDSLIPRLAGGNLVADESGRLAAEIIAPESQGGKHVIIASGVSGNSAKISHALLPQIFVSSIDKIQFEEKIRFQINLRGNGFKAGELISIGYNDLIVSSSSNSVRTNQKGSFNTTFCVSKVSKTGLDKIDVSTGSLENFSTSVSPIDIVDYSGDATATKCFTPIVPTPGATELPKEPPAVIVATGNATITLDPETSFHVPGFVGMEGTVIGADFIPDSPVDIYYVTEDRNYLLASDKTSAQGRFIQSYVIPQSPSGNYAIAATDGVNTAVASFIMDNIAPPVPHVDSMDTLQKYNEKIVLAWSPVEDPSGVTYFVEISQEPNFQSPMVAISGLLDLSYELSESENELVFQYSNLFWRVKSVDRAGNESGWSSSIQLKVESGKNMSETYWPLVIITFIGFALISIGVFSAWKILKRRENSA